MAEEGGISSLVIVQVLSAPAERVIFPLASQSPLNVELYPAKASSLTTYVPAERV